MVTWWPPKTATRAVTLVPGANTTRVWIDATPQLRAEHDARVRRQRAVAWAVGGAGLAMLAGGAALLATGLSDRDAAETESARLVALDTRCARTSSRAGCLSAQVLGSMRLQAVDELNAATARAIVGGVVLGLGVAGLVTGAVLRARSDPSDRYDRPRGWDVSVGFGGASLRGAF